MASLRKFPGSKYWYGCFTMPDGKRVQRSTRQKLRKPAQALADEWETLSKQRAHARQAHKVIADIYQTAHKESLPSGTPRSFITGWLLNRSKEVAPASLTAYKARATHFLKWLSDGADAPFADLDKRRLIAYRNFMAQHVSHGTVNHGIKILRMILEDARRDEFLAENPAKDVPLLKKSDGQKRRPFTAEQLRLILEVADREWRSMVIFGLYTGQRLADIARLTWQNVDLVADEIRLTTAKTGRLVVVPICAPLMRQIESLPGSDNPAQPLHPRANRHVTANGSTLSRQFSELLASVGLAPVRTHEKAGRGRDAEREQGGLSFHSLRHTLTSWLKNSGAGESVAMDIVGHESSAISQIYTHVENNAKLKALEAIPDITQ